MLGDRQFWTSNLRVTLLVRAPGAREREVVLKTIYQMSEAQFRQYWIAKVFRAEAASRAANRLLERDGGGAGCRDPGRGGVRGSRAGPQRA